MTTTQCLPWLTCQLSSTISSKLTEYYVYPDVAAKMIAAVQEHQKKGDYNSITVGNEFADALTSALREVSQDEHLFVAYNPFTSPESLGSSSGPHEPSPAEQARFRAMLEQQNCTQSEEVLSPGD